jgi:hypothetical protein
MKDMR